MGYLGHFIVYVLAMLGIIILALYVYKKFNINTFTHLKNSHLHVEDALNLTARKTLYVINANGERFLIAGDIDRTTLISKLDKTYPETTQEQVNSYIVEKDLRTGKKKSVIKNLVSKLSKNF